MKVPVLCAYQKCHETHPTISYTNCSHKIRKLVTNILQKKEKGKNRSEICSSLPVLSQLVIQFNSFAGKFLLHYRSWNLLLHYEIAKKPLQKSYSILCTYIYGNNVPMVNQQMASIDKSNPPHMVNVVKWTHKVDDQHITKDST